MQPTLEERIRKQQSDNDLMYFIWQATLGLVLWVVAGAIIVACIAGEF